MPLDLPVTLIVIASLSLSSSPLLLLSLNLATATSTLYFFSQISLSLYHDLVLGLWNGDFCFVFFVSLGLYIGIFYYNICLEAEKNVRNW